MVSTGVVSNSVVSNSVVSTSMVFNSVVSNRVVSTSAISTIVTRFNKTVLKDFNTVYTIEVSTYVTSVLCAQPKRISSILD